MGLASKVTVPKSSETDRLYEQVPDAVTDPGGTAWEVRGAMLVCWGKG